MTNDTKAPERIWAVKEPDWHNGNGEPFLGGTWDAGHLKEGASYIPEQDALALAAAAVAHPQDAQAALEARDKRVREEALREAMAVCEPGELTHYGPEPYRICQAKILALIEGDTDE